MSKKEAKSGEIQKLKSRIKRLEKENHRLKSEVHTLEQYKVLTSKYMDGELDGIPVEKVLEGINKSKKFNQIKKDNEGCPVCGGLLRKISYRAGSVIVCSSCDYRGTSDEKITDGE